MSSLRIIPSIEILLTQSALVHAATLYGRDAVTRAARRATEELRVCLSRGDLDVPSTETGALAWLERVIDEHVRAQLAPSLCRVINATGVILHTNLGRAPLAAAARAAVGRAAEGYGNLELDLESGSRGSRQGHVAELVAELTGAEAGLVVNNGAGAVLLAVAALAGDPAAAPEIVVSRGQLVEIGGGFRIPDVVAQSGARLVEVGTTNRTRRADYERALAAGGDRVAAILRVHTSNFRQLGFVEGVPIEALVGLGPPVIDDIGSGALAEDQVLVGDEPSARASVAAGAALVGFSGDKLLGGPQAGILAGRRDAIDRAAAHPLARALRIDKLSLAALEATLRLHRDPEEAAREIPTLAMLRAEPAVLEARAERLAAAFAREGAEIVTATAAVGGGTLPLAELPGPAVALDPRLAAELRAGDPPVIGRVHEDRLLLDPRTLTDEEVEWIARARR
jgi:L-seryl-tRNA(Ser) seleniumtransferase